MVRSVRSARLVYPMNVDSLLRVGVLFFLRMPMARVPGLMLAVMWMFFPWCVVSWMVISRQVLPFHCQRWRSCGVACCFFSQMVGRVSVVVVSFMCSGKLVLNVM